MRKPIMKLFMASLVLLATPAAAGLVALPPCASTDAEVVARMLRTTGVGGYECDDIREVGVDGIWAVAQSGALSTVGYVLLDDAGVLFVPSSADLLRLDAEADRIINLTEDLFAEEQREALEAVTSYISHAPEQTPARGVVNVFVDIDCGYCRGFHATTMPALLAQGVEVRYFAYALNGVDSVSYGKAAAVWCADDPAQAMSAFKMDEAQVGDDHPICEGHPVLEHMQLARQMGLTGTPYIVLGSGKVYRGDHSVASILTALELSALELSALELNTLE